MRQTFDDKTMVELLEIVLLGDETGDEAMWYVLHERMRDTLFAKYQECGEGLWDAYEDLVDDFFLYLREGKRNAKPVPYYALRQIKNKGAFDKWLLSTWRNFLCNRAEKMMDEALGMTDINYRVTNHRLKVNMRPFLERLLKGEKLRLDDKHKEISDSINSGFDGGNLMKDEQICRKKFGGMKKND